MKQHFCFYSGNDIDNRTQIKADTLGEAMSFLRLPGFRVDWPKSCIRESRLVFINGDGLTVTLYREGVTH